jgi:uncharacterized MAPEG superfamily protein
MFYVAGVLIFIVAKKLSDSTIMILLSVYFISNVFVYIICYLYSSREVENKETHIKLTNMKEEEK